MDYPRKITLIEAVGGRLFTDIQTLPEIASLNRKGKLEAVIVTEKHRSVVEDYCAKYDLKVISLEKEEFNAEDVLDAIKDNPFRNYALIGKSSLGHMQGRLQREGVLTEYLPLELIT